MVKLSPIDSNKKTSSSSSICIALDIFYKLIQNWVTTKSKWFDLIGLLLQLRFVRIDVRVLKSKPTHKTLFQIAKSRRGKKVESIISTTCGTTWYVYKYKYMVTWVRIQEDAYVLYVYTVTTTQPAVRGAIYAACCVTTHYCTCHAWCECMLVFHPTEQAMQPIFSKCQVPSTITYIG